MIDEFILYLIQISHLQIYANLCISKDKNMTDTYSYFVMKFLGLIIMIQNIIDELKNEFTKNYSEFKGIYFFGSRTKGIYQYDSDYDFVFIFDRIIDWKFKHQVRQIIYAIENDFDIIIDSKFFSFSDIINPNTLILQTAISEGIYYGL
jgi:predicted nucleotidyltransferase